ncbi:MAG: (2Fe-2S)-binding protein [Peptococcaceae bacterium]|nr:(2Fe-2S)-binding protein [Peptococcaceae bacterium]
MGTPAPVCGANPLDTASPHCPACGGPGKAVRPETVKSMIKDDRLPAVLEEYSLCLSKDCGVVYFGQQVFYKGDLEVRVWFKEDDPSVPVCYCKGVTEADIVEHISVRRCCRDIKDIQEHTGANTGKECLIKNPAGT